MTGLFSHFLRFFHAQESNSAHARSGNKLDSTTGFLNSLLGHLGDHSSLEDERNLGEGSLAKYLKVALYKS